MFVIAVMRTDNGEAERRDVYWSETHRWGGDPRYPYLIHSRHNPFGGSVGPAF